LEKIQPTPKAAPVKTGRPSTPPSSARRSSALQAILIPLLAVFTGLIIGAIVIIVTDAKVVAAFGNFFQAPGAAFAAAWGAITTAYGALFTGCLGSPSQIVAALRTFFATGQTDALREAFWPITESLVASTPYIFTGLAVALGFKAGLFNIGAEGQFFMGALASAFIGYSLKGIPWFIHMPLAVIGGFVAGALWGAVPGYLKATTGGHEVVNTIMMNWIGFRLSDWLLNNPMKASGYRPVTPVIEKSAELPRFFPDPMRFNLGFFLALIAAAIVFWLLFKTTTGFQLRAVGANPDAARYAGMSVPRTFVLAMTLSGGLAGIAGASQVLGVDHWVGQGFSAGYGFDAIAIALLGKSHPVGVVLAALLFGFLRSGATKMQSIAGIPIDIISIIQGLVIVFVAAPGIIRWLYRIKAAREEKLVLTRGWGSS
jgi:general nucleoside transport system permease protein